MDAVIDGCFVHCRLGCRVDKMLMRLLGSIFVSAVALCMIAGADALFEEDCGGVGSVIAGMHRRRTELGNGQFVGNRLLNKVSNSESLYKDPITPDRTANPS